MFKMIFVDFVERKKNWGWTSPRPVEKKKGVVLDGLGKLWTK
jgi:hypothetical protein